MIRHFVAEILYELRRRLLRRTIIFTQHDPRLLTVDLVLERNFLQPLDGCGATRANRLVVHERHAGNVNQTPVLRELLEIVTGPTREEHRVKVSGATRLERELRLDAGVASGLRGTRDLTPSRPDDDRDGAPAGFDFALEFENNGCREAWENVDPDPAAGSGERVPLRLHGEVLGFLAGVVANGFGRWEGQRFSNAASEAVVDLRGYFNIQHENEDGSHCGYKQIVKLT